MLDKAAVVGAVRPPAVRVPTLEPSASSSLFIGSKHAPKSNVYQKEIKRSTLSDYYKPRQTSVAWQDDSDIKELTDFDVHTNTTQIEELLSGICRTSPVSVAAAEDFGNGSPPPRNITPSRISGSVARSERRSGSPERTPFARSERRSGSPEQTPCARSLSAKRTSQASNMRARPAWNQNCPTPRVRPTITAPQTEPRLVARDINVKNRSRPWLEGLKRMDSSGSKLAAEKTKTPRDSTQKNVSQNFGNTPLCGRKSTSPASAVTPPTVSRKTRDSNAWKGEAALQPRLELLEKLLHESQQRVLRVEARCEEMEVALQTLTLQHHDTTSRLERRNAQLSAQLQYVLQWIEHAGVTKISTEVFAQDTDKDGVKETPDAEDFSHSFSNGSDAVCHSPASATKGSTDTTTGVEVAVKATPVRVPPAPPMTLQLQNH